MRFCPFCGHDNSDDAVECASCGKRLPAARPAPQRTPLPPPVKRDPKPLPPRPLELEKEPAPAPVVAKHEPFPFAAKAPIAEPAKAPITQPGLAPPAPKPAPPSVAERPSTLLGFKAPPTPRRSLFDESPESTDGENSDASDGGATCAPEAELPPAPTARNDAPVEVAVTLTPRPAPKPAPKPETNPNALATTDANTDGNTALAAPDLPPMPPTPSTTNLLNAVQYLWPLWRAQRARRRAQEAIRTELIADQHILDKILRELGKTAREVNVDLPAIADEMARVKACETTVSQAEVDLAELTKKIDAETTRFDAESNERARLLSGLEGELAEREAEGKARASERAQHLAERDRLDMLIREAERRASALDQKAQRADVTPADKGGGPHTAANARAQAELLRKEATSHIGPRDDARDRAAALDGPINVISEQIRDLKEQIGERRRAVADAQQTHAHAMSSLQGDITRVEDARSSAEREISQRFVAAGTLLNLKRTVHPRFQPIYTQIDDLKRNLVAKESDLVRLEAERTTFDRPTVQRGLLVVGGTFAGLVLIVLTLIILLARH